MSVVVLMPPRPVYTAAGGKVSERRTIAAESKQPASEEDSSRAVSGGRGGGGVVGQIASERRSAGITCHQSRPGLNDQDATWAGAVRYVSGTICQRCVRRRRRTNKCSAPLSFARVCI